MNKLLAGKGDLGVLVVNSFSCGILNRQPVEPGCILHIISEDRSLSLVPTTGGRPAPAFFLFSLSRYNVLMVQALLNRLENSKSFRRLSRYWLTVAFIGGFLLDNITLNRVDQVFDNVILATYVVLSMVALLLMYAGSAQKLPEEYNEKARLYSPLYVQFAFGGLLSGMLIFYGRSGDFSQSWPFILLILFVIYANETLRDRSARLVFNLAIFFIGLFSYMVLIVPVLTGYMSVWTFLGSGLIAVFIMYLFVLALFKVVPRFLTMHLRAVIFTIGAIYVTFNSLYFTNIIPPIPLSLKDVGIFHSVVRFEDGNYQLKYEKGKWWQPFKNSDDTFHAGAGDNMYCFAKVFAPTKLSTEIYHRWEYKNVDGQWVEHFRTSYPISGGNDGGYRGYTLVKSFNSGEWRCSVETARGQVLGRETFEVEKGTAPGELETRYE